MKKRSPQVLSPLERTSRLKERLRALVHETLEKKYEMEMNTAEKITDNYFAEGALPDYYFFSNAPEEIADHIFIITQMLNANTEFVRQESRDGKVLTYFINVGRDFPGKLIRTLEENEAMAIAAFDSVKTRSGIRILTLETWGREEFPVGEDEEGAIGAVREQVLRSGHSWSEQFLASLPANYLTEEISIIRQKSRIGRHLELFSRAMESDCAVVMVDEAEPDSDRLAQGRKERRVGIAIRNPSRDFIRGVLRVFEQKSVNLHRSYFDTFVSKDGKDRVGILSLYILSDADHFGDVAWEIGGISCQPDLAGPVEEKRLEEKLVGLVRTLSTAQAPEEKKEEALRSWAELAKENCDLESDAEHRNFLLNAVSDFHGAAEFLGIAEKPSVMELLLRFEHLSEFFVSSQQGDRKRNLPGFRFAHSATRGPSKGGLRLDPIVRFDEVCALAFMMTFKTAKSRILCGGAKGGMIVSPREFLDRRLDFVDTLTNFGRSLFLVTGPNRDVPAGDVGCGPDEIGILFEGFKSALRDLALIAYGLKKGAADIGNRVVSLTEAREMLRHNFDVDYNDRLVLRELISSERYLELVAAAQITGKPRMGIEVRGSATGRGLRFSILAMATRLFLEGKWTPAEPLSEGETELLKKVAGITEKRILEKGGMDLLSEDEWQELDGRIYPKLLRDKKVVVQGSGKVGASVLSELDPYGVNVVAVADVGGALIGDHLDVDEMLEAVATTRERSVVSAKKGVKKVVKGAKEGSVILEEPCDILLPCALENVIDAGVARRVQAKVIVCGGNGTNTSKAERILHERGIPVLYDFLANGGGVTASYFEWLRNLTDRRRYEAEAIYGRPFDISVMDGYIMPEFRDRIKGILREPESPRVTEQWSMVMRDIMFAAVNDDLDFAGSEGISMKTAGFAKATLRLMAAEMARMDVKRRAAFWKGLPKKTRAYLHPYLQHPELRLFNPDFDEEQWLA
ncbi:MAG TPA: Glu/Leu/Phe/Val dehydrogenase dimerization domain-containing protein [Syntrophales bacterium]|nr:Glu/Leu/Phe/Val dehydrogenase dimerization domain-containing protein [Syntrophales bacterium]